MNCLNHPNRKTQARELCASCYGKWWRSTDEYEFHYREKERIRDRRRWAGLSPEQKLDKTYRSNYGLTYQEVQDIYDSQDQRCAACKNKINLGFDQGVVDHCHNSDQIRGILCPPCNKALGFVFDDTERLRGLIRYLEEHNGKHK